MASIKIFSSLAKTVYRGNSEGQEEVFNEGVFNEGVFNSEAKDDIERSANTIGIKVVQKGGCPANWHPVGTQDWDENN